MKSLFGLLSILFVLVVIRIANPSPITQAYDPLVLGIGLLTLALLVVVEAAKESPKFAQLSRQLVDVLMPSYGFFLVLYILINFVIFPARVNGTSMIPTYQSGDVVLFSRLGELERLDVVFVNVTTERTDHFTNEFMLKRVVGMPGDELDIINGQLLVNGIFMTEPYTNGPMLSTGLPCFSPIECRVVPQGMIFVLGDNRNSSIDSRSYGLVPMSDVIGRSTFNLREVFS
jgi:signal peptidase I